MENSYHKEILGPGRVMTKERWYDKLDLLLAVGTCSIGLEYLPFYFDIDSRNFTIAWLVMPPLLMLSFTINLKKYLSVDIIKWNLIFLVPLILYALSVKWNEDIPFGTVPETLMGISLSLIIFSFFIVHGGTSKGHFTFAVAVILIGAIAAMLNIASVIGLSDKGTTVYHLGNNVYITRISPLGDPNITTIYFLGFAASLPFWQDLFGKAKGFVVGTACFGIAFFAISGSASRGGSIAMIFSGLVMYYWLWVKDKHSRVLVVLLMVLVFLSLFIDIQNPIHPKELNTLIERFNQLALEGRNEVNAYTRLVSISWLIEDLFTGPRLVGIGFERFGQDTFSRGGLWLPHNSFVDLYVIGGIIGLLAFIKLWWVALRAQITNIDVENESLRLYRIWYIAYGAGLGILVFSVSIAWTKLIWAFLGMSVALSGINKINSPRSKGIGL